MICNCHDNKHMVNGMLYTSGVSLVLTTTNSTNINDLEDYNFFLPCNQNPDTIVTGDPVQVYMTINGTNYPLRNKYGLPVFSNYLKRRKSYHAWYVTDGTTAWVTLKYLPCCKAHA